MPPVGQLIQKFLRFFFHHLYTTIAWIYDFVAMVSSVGQWRTWQQAGVDAIQQGTVLELGYGTGHVLLNFFKGGIIPFGADPSRQMAGITKRRLRKAGFEPRITLATAQTLPFPSETFDSIISTFPSDYILEQSTLAEAWRVLVPKGRFVIIPGIAKITGYPERGLSILSVLDRAASLLYRTTGESIDPELIWKERIRERFIQEGFEPELSLIQQDRAVVIRIIAIKQP
ncbi:MAG: methyltransferase domain-containing protein [Anaerolineales bacterium]|nr:methyltransferase domain-containing protein [Anaerolineales bacterium]